MATIDINVHQAIADFDSIKARFVEKGIEIPEGTKTSEYPGKISEFGQKEYLRGNTDGYSEGCRVMTDSTNSQFASIREAIENHGVPVSDDTLRSQYPDKIAEVYVMGRIAGNQVGYAEGIISGKSEIEVTVIGPANSALERCLYDKADPGELASNSLGDNVNKAIDDFCNIRNALQSYVDIASGTPTDIYYHNIKDVYNVGQRSGYTDGYENGLREGKAQAKDPVATAVMEFIGLTDEKTGHTTSYSIMNRPSSTFHYLCESGYECVIVPAHITNIDINALGTVGAYDMSRDRARVLMLPTVPPIMEAQSGWSEIGDNLPPKAIYVPDESVDAYKSAETWSEFADLIMPMSLIGKITFTVCGREFSAKEGQTWEEWISSEYCIAPADFYIDGTYVIYDDHSPVLYEDDTEVRPSEAILPNHLYQQY